MDPDKLLDDLRRAIRTGHTLEALEAFEHLDRWLCEGGFPPTEWTKPDRHGD